MELELEDVFYCDSGGVGMLGWLPPLSISGWNFICSGHHMIIKCNGTNSVDGFHREMACV
jgi:hypothetical protein